VNIDEAELAMLPMKMTSVDIQFDLFAKELESARISRWRLGRLLRDPNDERLMALDQRMAFLRKLPEGFSSIYRVPFLDAAECEFILSEADAIAANVGWSHHRHANYPTPDLPLSELPRVWERLRPCLERGLFPLLQTVYGLRRSGWFCLDLFVVSYRAEHQRSLDVHEDSSLLTVSIMLSDIDAFTGGGLHLPDADITIHSIRGEALIHAGKWQHQGLPINRGRRDLLVCFLDHIDMPYDRLVGAPSIYG
tara:strand:+ start:147 stop:899 length:753 start_codon:yes stop_codon:yes gene_type:complete